MKPLLKKPVEKPRILPLDSLRGFAAISVVTSHILGGTYYARLISLTPLYILTAGHEAVIFFFLLSGYVLVYRYGLGPRFNYGEFLTMRFLRLYIPYIVSIALCIILFMLCRPGLPGNAMISAQWHAPLTLKVLLGHFLLIGNFNTLILNPSIWSLVFEMRIAIMFPILLYFLQFDRVKLLIIVLLVTLVSASAIVLNTILWKSYYNSGFFTLYYLYIFIAGGYIAKNQAMLVAKYNSLKHTSRLLLTMATFLLYCYAHVILLAIADIAHSPNFDKMQFLVQDFFTALASFYFIIAAISITNDKNILKNSIPLFLGKISYSLYLVHLPIIYFIYFELSGKLPTLLVFVSGFVLSLLVATIFNKYIEQSAVKWAKRILTNKSTNVIPASA